MKIKFINLIITKHSFSLIEKHNTHFLNMSVAKKAISPEAIKVDLAEKILEQK